MFDPAQLAALAAVHRRGSFDLAAAELHVTPSAISQRLKALEETAGALLIRRGQPCTATPAGLRLIRHHDELTLLERTLATDLPWLSPRPATLRIAVNADSLATWVIPALAATDGFLFDLVIDDQDVSQDWLKRGEVAAAITAHPGPLQGCDTIPLGALRYRATASPAYMARWMPDGVTAAALAAAPALRFSDKDRLQDIWVEQQIGAKAKRAAFPSHRLASSQAFVDGCLAGLGWAMNPEVLAAPYLASGALVEMVPNTPLDVALHWQFSRLTAPALASLTREIRAAAGRVLVGG
ncbi:MAG: LysR family transcriptional regulator ArgP [Cypionkella sp.]|uniref:LysR family transcriptional regulator ArgP n=1 Tax=Cypionkella sp. TaxID=2811411 RepID=UPI00262632AA|nr:LysR family transcriptional regulator ArgP [Cypionkella sp.]MDB5661042.1 LysR family transcriptional regulator ArgP [Cypionkella sp.]